MNKTTQLKVNDIFDATVEKLEELRKELPEKGIGSIENEHLLLKHMQVVNLFLLVLDRVDKVDERLEVMMKIRDEEPF